MSYRFIKRFFDLTFSLFLIIVLLPIYFITYILIAIDMGHPAIFKQTRPGKNKKNFTLFKFRSMINDESIDDDKRITKLGMILRKTSIDELPQLFSVLRGDMSLIGPRPLLEEYNDQFTDEENKRFFVRPGISGLSQVNGRNNLGWDQKLKLDVKYVENQSILLDIKIFFLTIYTVFMSIGFTKSVEKKFERNTK